jgi:hypothetical protein
MKTENVSALKIHKMSQEQFDREFENGNVSDNEMYLTPDVDKVGDLSNLRTNAKTSVVDAINELFALLNK